ncbi:MAG: hypothetical protein JNK15_21460, partial [Planctomycetes bacterium]|nr:hypothetical protein [Planctomycetota bacterium]
MGTAMLSRLLGFVVLVSASPGLAQSRLAAAAALADAFATESGGFVLAVPGVADDFVVFADGAFVERANGTARLSVYAQRQGSIDREFLLVLECSGRVAPGSPGYPPAGMPITTLVPAAYAPTGPVDPQGFVYYTQAVGTLTGLRTYAGAAITVTAAGPLQLGAGANNKNVGQGCAVDLLLSVVQQPFLGPLPITGPAQLRCDLRPDLAQCLTHVDADPAASGVGSRAGVGFPGVAADYVFVPGSTLVEDGLGGASLTGGLRSQSNYADAWQF